MDVEGRSEEVTRPEAKGWTLGYVKHRFFQGWASFSRSYRRLLVICLEQVAFLGIDLDLQMDALRDDFVASKSFRLYVESVFDECDVEGSGKLDGGEFYAAVLLLYHHLNKIPFSRKKFPPKREVVMRLFQEYYEQQQVVLELIEKKGMMLEDLKDPKDKQVSSQRTTTDSRLKKVAPKVVRESAFTLVFFFIYLSVYNLWLCRHCEPVMSVSMQAASGFIALALGLFLFNGTEIVIDELPHANLFHRTSKRLRAKEAAAQAGKHKKEATIPEVYKITFLAMCEDHFSDVLASETWRILSVAVILPLAAYQLKRFLFRIRIVSDVFHSQRLFPEEAVVPTFVSLVLLIFPFIDSYVEKNVLWHDFAAGNHREYFKKYNRRALLDPKRWKMMESNRDSLRRHFKSENLKRKRAKRREKFRKSILEWNSDAEGIDTVRVEGSQHQIFSDTDGEQNESKTRPTTRKKVSKNVRRRSVMSDEQEPEHETDSTSASREGNKRKKSYFSDDDPVEVLSDSGVSQTGKQPQKTPQQRTETSTSPKVLEAKSKLESTPESNPNPNPKPTLSKPKLPPRQAVTEETQPQESRNNGKETTSEVQALKEL